jgi:hypothetical protein
MAILAYVPVIHPPRQHFFLDLSTDEPILRFELACALCKLFERDPILCGIVLCSIRDVAAGRITPAQFEARAADWRVGG